MLKGFYEPGPSCAPSAELRPASVRPRTTDSPASYAQRLASTCSPGQEVVVVQAHPDLPPPTIRVYRWVVEEQTLLTIAVPERS